MLNCAVTCMAQGTKDIIWCWCSHFIPISMWGREYFGILFDWELEVILVTMVLKSTLLLLVIIFYFISSNCYSLCKLEVYCWVYPSSVVDLSLPIQIHNTYQSYCIACNLYYIIELLVKKVTIYFLQSSVWCIKDGERHGAAAGQPEGSVQYITVLEVSVLNPFHTGLINLRKSTWMHFKSCVNVTSMLTLWFTVKKVRLYFIELDQVWEK